MGGIHFCPVIQTKGKEIGIQPALKDGTVFDLCLMALPWLEFYLAFQVNIPGRQSL